MSSCDATIMAITVVVVVWWWCFDFMITHTTVVDAHHCSSLLVCLSLTTMYINQVRTADGGVAVC